jgi:hypothetical protein
MNLRTVNTPGNALIGYGDRISLMEAMEAAEDIQTEFQKILSEKTIRVAK